jgi:hypothetical protein
MGCLPPLTAVLSIIPALSNFFFSPAAVCPLFETSILVSLGSIIDFGIEITDAILSGLELLCCL